MKSPEGELEVKVEAATLLDQKENCWYQHCLYGFVVCQPQSSGHFEFISPSLRGCFKRSRVICQEICPKVFLTLFSGVEGLGAWPLPPRSKRIFCVSIYGDRGNVTCTTSDCHLCYTLDTRQCTTRICHLCTTITRINALLGFVSVAHNELLLFQKIFFHFYPAWTGGSHVKVSGGPLYLVSASFTLLLWQRDWYNELNNDENAMKWLDFPVRCATFRSMMVGGWWWRYRVER